MSANFLTNDNKSKSMKIVNTYQMDCDNTTKFYNKLSIYS